MAEAPPKPLHKPSESHTLDEVLKSLQDLIRNELVEPQAGQQPDIAKRSVAPPKIPPTVKPASRWEARGLGKAKPKPKEDVDVDAVLSSLRDIVSHELSVHAPRRLPPAEPVTPPDSEPQNVQSTDEALRIEWTENLDAAAALLDTENEPSPMSVDDTRTPDVEEMQFEALEPLQEEPAAKSVDETPSDFSTANIIETPGEAPDKAPPVESRNDTAPTVLAPEPSDLAPPATPETLGGEQQSFLFDSAQPPAKASLPDTTTMNEISFDLDALPDAIELDELTHDRAPAIKAEIPPPAPTSPVESIAEPVKADADIPDQPDMPLNETPADTGPSEATTLRLPDDFDAITPVNVEAIPSVEFEPSGISLSRKAPATAEPTTTTLRNPDEKSADSPQATEPAPAVEEAPKSDTSASAAPEPKTDDAAEAMPVIQPPASESTALATVAIPERAAVEPVANAPPVVPEVTVPPAAVPVVKADDVVPPPTKPNGSPTSAEPEIERPVVAEPMTPRLPMMPSKSTREIAVRTIAKLNIELRRCGERTLDPRMVDRLQFVLQELLNEDPGKKSS